jgi:hypothetical protein
MAAFSEKGLQALNQAWVTQEQLKYDAERRVSIAEANSDTYSLAEAFQDYANAAAQQRNLYSEYQHAEQAAQQQQQANQPSPASAEQRAQRLPHEMDVYDVAKVCNLDPKYYLSYKQHYDMLKAKKAID